MRGLNLLIVIYSVLCIVLGIYGAVSAKEYYSLSGVLIGALQLGCLAWTKTNPRWGRIGSLVIALLVLGRFMPKFIKDGTWLPAGVLSIASIVLVIALLAGHLMANKSKKNLLQE